MEATHAKTGSSSSIEAVAIFADDVCGQKPLL